MRAIRKLLGISVLVGFQSLVAENVMAQLPPTLTLDETGQATLDYHNGNGVVALIGTAGLYELVPGQQFQAVVYDVRSLFSFDPGDVVLQDPGTSATSDLVRFDPDGKIYLFSTLQPGDATPDMADSVTPGTWATVLTHLQSPNYSFSESTGAGGAVGLFNYAPYLGDPGGSDDAVTYNVVSSVPEPTTFVMLLGFGVAGLLSYGWRRWRA